MITKEDLAKAILDLKESQKKTDEQLKKTDEQLKKTDEQIQKLEKAQERSDKKLDKIAKLVGAISNNQGDVAEEFFYNSLKQNPQLKGIKFDFIDKNVTRVKNNIEDEYDILLVNGKDIAIIETKYKAHEKDIDKLVTKKYENFKKLYPEYKDYNHHLALASFYINPDVKDKALSQGVILLQRKGNLIETITN